VVEEEVGYTLDDYFADKQAKSKGLLAKKTELREKEKIQDKVASRDGTKVNVTGIANSLSWRDNHAIQPDANAVLLGFQANDDDETFEGRGRGRGGRGGRD